MTTPAAIYQDFLALIAGGAITGDAPVGLAALLAQLGTQSLPVTGGRAGQTADGAWMSGNTSFRGTSWSFNLTGRPGGASEPADYTDLTLAMTATQTTPWTFAQAFPGDQLPKSRRAKSTLQVPPPGAGLVLGPSVVAPLVVETPALNSVNFPADAIPLPHLAGWLILTDSVLAGYIDYFGTSRLRIDGPIDFTDPLKPILFLNAPAPGATTDFGPHITLDAVGLRLRNDFPDPSPLPEQDAPTSAAMLYATFSADTIPRTVADMSAPLLYGDYVWPIHVSFGEHPLTLSTGAQMLGKLIGAPDGAFSLPPGVPLLNLFGVSELEFGLDPPMSGVGFGVSYSSVGIVSTEPWDPPIPFTMIDQVGVRWMFDWQSDPTLMTASIWGTMTFGAKKAQSLGAMAPVSRRWADWHQRIARAPRSEDATDDPVTVTLTIRMDIPDMAFIAYTENPIALPISDAFAAYFSVQPPDVPTTLTVSEANFIASLPRKTYQAGMTVLGQWPVTCGTIVFNLDRIEFRVQVSQSSVSGSIVGTVAMAVPDSAPVQLMFGAEYPGDGSWLFTGELVGGPINLPKFVLAFLGYPYPDWLKNDSFVLELTAFSVSYSTATGNPYRVAGAVAAALKDTVLGIPVAMAAAAEIERMPAPAEQGEGAMVTVGKLSGSFAISRLKLTASVSFRENEKTYTFSVAWRQLTLSGATAWIGEGTGRHQILTLRLSGETLGGVVRFLVSLANPNANFRLDPPWDFLDTIELGRFALVIDPTLEQVTLTYDVNLNLAFARVDTVGLRYDRSSGTPRVNFVLTGQMLGTSYPQGKPLTWDAVDQAPPAVPGKGQSLFDLRYFGLGQHVSLDGLTSYTSISDVIDAMRAEMAPFDDPRKVPIQPGKTRFDPASQWLFGIDCTIMDTVTLKLVLHDPDLYGVLIALGGPDAGSLSGLSFELLYKKVTADVGVFHVRLQVPDAFRQLQFGAVSVTLGIITVDIYTNGNFLIDLGFPHNRDFSVSFGVEAGIFNGRGGIYFGVRDGSTSDRVPRISNGTFSPVIELGVGLEIGVGRTFNKGPLKAGLYVDVVVIFEGVLSWFHPSDTARPNALYYWCRGTAGIVGKLYGSVDFKVISVSVSVEAHAYATLTLAAHQATLIELDVGVSVHAKVKILFVSISFSFGLTIEASFTIGSSSATPWTLLPGESTRSQAARLTHAYAPARRRPPHVKAVTRHAYRLQRFGHPAGALLATGGATVARATASPPAALFARGDGLVAGVAEPADPVYHLVFDKDAAVFPGGAVRSGTLTLTPAFTVANVPVDWTGEGPPPPNAEPDYRIAMLLVADAATAPGDGVAPARKRARLRAGATLDEDAIPTSFGAVAEGLLRWSLYALGITDPAAVVTLGALEELVEQLALPEAASQGFTWDNLDGFFNHNVHLTLAAAAPGVTTVLDATVFPMIPPLQWDAPQLPPEQVQRQFWIYQPVDATYEAEVLAYFADLDARAPDARPDPQQRMRAARDAGEDTEAMARFVFRDYCQMVARTAAQSAVTLLGGFPHSVAATDSLASIAGSFPTTQIPYVVQPGDDVDSVAEALGMAAAELIALNPGIAAAIADTPPGGTIAITLGVTAQSIAAANPGWAVVDGKQITLGDLVVAIPAGGTIAGIAQSYSVDPAAWLGDTALLAATGIARPGASLALPAFAYANPLALPVATVAAVYWVRLSGYRAEAAVPGADWYAEAIAALNPGQIPVSGPLPATLLVPSAFDQDSSAPPPPPITWQTLPGDTLDSVAGAVAATQIGALDPAYAAWLAAVVAANATPLPDGAVALPANAALIVRPDDTLANIRLRLLLGDTSGQQAAFVGLVEGADILVPLAALLVPGARVTTVAGQTLVTLAQSYGLSAEDLGGRVADEAGLLATDDDRRLTVPSVPAIGLDALSAALHDPAVEAEIAAQTARFMLYGVRIPAPVESGGVYHATGPMTGLYDLVGQQVTGPPPSGEIVDPALAVTVSKGQPCGWLSFATTSVTSGETPAELAASYPAAARDPRLARLDPHSPAPKGMLALADAVESITLSISHAELVNNYPATGLVPAIEGAIAPLQLYREMKLRHGVTQPIVWRTTVAPLLPGTPSAEAAPSLWLLPSDLLGLGGNDGTASSFALMQIAPQAGPSAQPAELGAYAWSTLIDFDVRSVPGSPAIVEMLGADTADRQLLANLLQYLGAIPLADGSYHVPPAGEAATLILAWQLPASSGTQPALTSTPLTPAGTFLVKVNLSTETHSGPPPLGVALVEPEEPSAGPYFASLSDAADFLTLLWEGSVVGGGGYWLHAEGGDEPIPQSIFDQDGRAVLTVAIQLASQSSVDSGKAWPVRKLFAFNNCAVVGDGVDPGSVALFAEASDPAELVRSASIPQGQVGFTLDLHTPDSSGPPDDPQTRLRALYSLIGYQLADMPAFAPSDEGQPLGPTVKTDADGTLEETSWNLMRVVPIHRFAKANPLVDMAGLPPPGASPYAGIPGASSGTDWTMAQTRVSLWFHDVLGNASAAAGEAAAPDAEDALVASVDVPVGYTDPLVGVGSWPSTTLSYQVLIDPQQQGQALLRVRAALQGVVCQPGAGEGGDAVLEKTGRERDRWAAVYYQMLQPDVGAALLTSLRQAPGADPDAVAVPMAPLRALATGAYAFVRGQAERRRYIASAPQSIDALCAHYGVAYERLGTANALVPLDAILAGPSFALPQVAMLRANQSVAQLAAAAVPPADPAAVLQDADNIALPLNAGTELNTPDRPLAVPDPSPDVLALLALAGCSLDRLVARNKATASLLTPGFIFECNGIQVQIDAEGPGSDATLDGVVSVFNGQGLPFDATMVVSLNADRPGMFRAGATLMRDAYTLTATDTLAQNGAGATPAELAPLNIATPTLFPDGTSLFLQTVATPIPNGRVLGDIAGDAGVTPGDVLRHNGAAALAATPQLAVPGLSDWPADGGAPYGSYTLREGDTLDAVAPRLGPPDTALPAFTPLELATMNAVLPGTIAPGVTVTVGGQSEETEAGDSFQSLCDRFSPPVTLDALVAAIEGTPGVLAAGGLLLCPAGRLGPATEGQPGVVPADVAARFGVSAAGLVGANAGTPGLIVAGLELRASTQSVATQTTAAADSITAILDRFAQAKVTTSIDDLLLANAEVGFLTAGAAVSLPPADAVLEAALAIDVGGTLTWRWPDVIFPIHCWLQVERAAALVDPSLAGTLENPSGAVRARTAVAASRTGSPSEQPDGGATTLTGFADQLQQAIPALRVATGKTLAEEQQGSAGTDVWAVDFSSTGIAQVSVTPPVASVPGTSGPQPRSYALRPLSTVLVARQDVEIATLDPATGLLSGTLTANYQGIDLELWARSFLTDVEHVLTATYVAGGYAVRSSALQRIIEAKKTLAGAISRGLDAVLVGQGGDDSQRDSAAETLRQSLLVSLTQGYRTAAVMQYATSATTSFTGPAARFSGVPVATLSSEDPELKAATLSNGKISLENGASLVNVLVSIPDVEAHSSLAMALDYQVVELEFNVADELDGYQRSDWLSFVTPIASGSPPALAFTLGTPDTPLPLRTYPQMPTLLDHRAVPAEAPASVAEAVLWSYGFTLRHQSAEQDQIEMELSFNSPPETMQARAIAEDDLFGQLAQYSENAAGLLDILAELPSWQLAADQTRLANALSSFADCAEGVAAAWDQHWAPVEMADAVPAARAVGAPVPETYGFSVDLGADSTATYYETLTLVRTQKPQDGQVGWPDIVCFTPEGVPLPLTPAPASSCQVEPSDDLQCYLFPTDEKLRVPAFSLVSFDFRFGGLPVAAYQNATAKAWVVRNARLLGPTGAATQPDFIYRTPVLSYYQPVVPFIDVASALPIGDWSYDPATCPLNQTFATIFDGDASDRAIAMGVRYGYQLAPGNPPDVPALETYLPVLQTPGFGFADTTIADTCARLQLWDKQNDPVRAGGCWSFWIDLYSSVDPSLQRPVLRLKHCVSPFPQPE
ncbi:hypothetical protein FPZ54_08980 [Sphingomonas suaedae]|uniref:LysM domain-containing protein n=1 Tax=Sphingomonas suaedae TaxID=2599297 RepID=A0A518RFA2_9SPHN|nr:LysM peptidoglycan-binding domain-containing protein [Sphingomonas suaedae]QDX26142.1 hypothetical protein FPZ54_08980 [Sphingomonas suaedae]